MGRELSLAGLYSHSVRHPADGGACQKGRQLNQQSQYPFVGQTWAIGALKVLLLNLTMTVLLAGRFGRIVVATDAATERRLIACGTISQVLHLK